MAAAMENDENTASYSADFRSIFGSDVHNNESNGQDNATGESGGENRVEHKDSEQITLSVPPSSLMTSSGDSFNHHDDRNYDSNITPSILLEQLAYVDNFMPSLEQDFANLDSWVIGGNDFGNRDSMNSLSGQGIQSHNVMGVDERLALELNAFADDSFIFPDEDKSQLRGHERGGNSGDDKSSIDDDDDNDVEANGNNSGNSNNNSNNNNNNNDNNKSRSHFLTQRRNTFLTSQYDHSKSRFSSKKRRKLDQTNENASIGNPSPSPQQDHGGFSNFDVTPTGHNVSNIINNFYSPSISSPLNNPRTSQSISSVNSATISPSANTMVSNMDTVPQIEMPDYSTIPTSTLVSLLPKVRVPPNAYKSLIEQGLDADQIDAIAVIIAVHQRQKMNESRFKTPQNLDSSQDSEDAARSASFLLNILSNGNEKVDTSRNSQADDHNETREQVPQSGDEFLSNSTDVSSNDIRTNTESKGVDLSSKRHPSLNNSESQLTDLIKESNKMSTSRRQSSSDLPSQGVSRRSHQKRKLKENELEASVQELSELAISLQQKIHTLEMENSLLKNLVTSSGEIEGIEKAENIRRDILSNISSQQKGAFNSAPEKTS